MAVDKSQDLLRQRNALIELSDEIMSILHAHQLKAPQMQSNEVREWIRGLYDLVQKGLGKPAHFYPDTEA